MCRCSKWYENKKIKIKKPLVIPDGLMVILLGSSGLGLFTEVYITLLSLSRTPYMCSTGNLCVRWLFETCWSVRLDKIVCFLTTACLITLYLNELKKERREKKIAYRILAVDVLKDFCYRDFHQCLFSSRIAYCTV